MGESRKHLAAIAAKVGKVYGVDAPFPPARVTDKLIKYKNLKHLVEWAEREGLVSSYVKRFERMKGKVPEPYLS